MIWFSADWHFGHAGILIHQSQRLNEFETIENMDNQILDGINSVVKKNDEIFFLGDFAFNRYGHYRSRINCRTLHVIKGNHDAPSLKNFCTTLCDIKIKKFMRGENVFKIVMCHYPMVSWPGLHDGAFHLYGHCHGSMEEQLTEMFPNRRSFDVGIDNVKRAFDEWRPLSLDEVIYLCDV
jgi:calcineurin-like phosphoesterase family protein